MNIYGLRWAAKTAILANSINQLANVIHSGIHSITPLIQKGIYTTFFELLQFLTPIKAELIPMVWKGGQWGKYTKDE